MIVNVQVVRTSPTPTGWHNALKYGREKGKIRIGFKQEETRYQFEVWNEGRGLSPDEIALLFQRFVRLGDDVKGYRSTGLGLYHKGDHRKAWRDHPGRIPTGRVDKFHLHTAQGIRVFLMITIS